jgi:simple sugar transport system permease protein
MSLGQLDRFFDGMISGKGMMAVIAVKMGKWAPGGILGTALLLGLFDALQMKLQVANTIGLSPELLGMVPYLRSALFPEREKCTSHSPGYHVSA